MDEEIGRQERTEFGIAVFGELDDTHADIAALVWDFIRLDIGCKAARRERDCEEDLSEKHRLDTVLRSLDEEWTKKFSSASHILIAVLPAWSTYDRGTDHVIISGRSRNQPHLDRDSGSASGGFEIFSERVAALDSQ